MLTYNLKECGSTPKYIYLFRCIRKDIIDGRIKKGERLPSKRALASHLNVGVITVANAYAQLATEGFITAEEKRGYFVQDISTFRAVQDVLKGRSGGRPEFPANQEEQKEKEFFADFKANRTGLQHFPATRWNYYMREALSLNDDTLLKTIPYNGLYRLRRAISEYLYRERGMDVLPSQIIIGAGTEYLYSRLIQLFGRACTFASEDPGYKKFAAISRSYGNPWIHVPIDEKGLRVDLLEEYGADVVHVSPANHFPTGLVMPVARRAELFEWVNRVKKRYIIEDDYDCEFRYSGQLILPLYAQDTQNKVIYFNTFSKTLVPSLRISYMVLPPALMQKYEQTLSFYSCTVSSFEQYALSRFIENGDLERHINRMRNYYRKQRKIILDAIAASPLSKIARVLENNAGTHFLLEVKTDMTEAQIRAEGRKRNMLLSMVSDYSDPAADRDPNGPSGQKPGLFHTPGSCILVINYAAIETEKVQEVVQRLYGIFGKQEEGQQKSQDSPAGISKNSCAR